MGLFKNIIGDNTKKLLSKYDPLIKEINGHEEGCIGLSDKDLASKTEIFRDALKNGASFDGLLPEAYATVREASRRTTGLRHFDVQLLGGIILYFGHVTEMRTGEGKTLVSTLPVYMHALTGAGVHVVTVNDYLAQRDAVWMGQVHHALGLSVSVIGNRSSYIYDPDSALNLDTKRDETGSYHIVHEFLRICTRAEAYAADVVYGTNSEFGFDYLRDNVARDKSMQVQRKHAFAVVDEIDSILIDEARTPLIISAPIGEGDSMYPQFAKIAKHLTKEIDYTIDEKLKATQLTDSGIEKAENILGVDNIYTEGGIKQVHHLETAVRAAALFEKDRDYVVKDGEVVIVDQFTGRLQPGRRWSEGLHQAIEAKEGVPIKEESRTFASITYQNYFRMYEKLSGMTGTALTSAEEFAKVYGLETFSIPTHAPMIRKDNTDVIFQTEKGKFTALVREIKLVHETGRPILVGTVSIEKNELLSTLLKKEGVTHKVLNAKSHESEGEVIAQAGRKGAVTIATNMAGRGVDVKLGGASATKNEYEEVKALGGLYVIGTERHEARRIDNQLRGRSGRQGDPGETQFFVSLEDSLMRAFASERIKNMMGRFNIPPDEPIANTVVSKAIESAQSKIEGFNFDARKHILEFDDVLNHQRKTIYGRRQEFLTGDINVLNKHLNELISQSGRDAELASMVGDKKGVMGEEIFWKAFQSISIQSIDLLWMEHLEVMDYIRGSVNLRAYGQRDPLVEYKKEGLRLFKELEQSINKQIISLLPRIDIGYSDEYKEDANKFNNSKILTSNKGKVTTGSSDGPVKHGEKVGRNDSCPCGSGKKYKKCHGA